MSVGIHAEDNPAPPENPADSVILPDSTLVPDSVIVPDSALVNDSLTAAQKALQSFEKRRKKFEERRPRPSSYSLLDTLILYFTSERYNRGSQVRQSIYNNAGDHFRFDPSYFSVEYQTNPMRTTVSPFGLRGDYIGVVHNGLVIHPFEHTVEPDGQINFDDIPTASDNDIYIIPGPVGSLFGADNSLASLVTRPRRPEVGVPQTALLVDKGSFFYNYVRGRYSKRFIGGREIDMAIAYRNADGPSIRREDDAYHYYGRALLPLSADWAMHLDGHLYDRKGGYVVWPDVGGSTMTRGRFDRNLRTSIERYNTAHTRRHEFGYTHLRQGSNITGNYSGRFNITGNGLFLNNEFYRSSAVWTFDMNANYTEFDYGPGSRKRWDGEAKIRRLDLSDGWRYAVSASVGYTQDFDPLPSAVLALHHESERFLTDLSVGYSTRAPSQHELLLPFQTARVYGTGGDDYGEVGNSDLKEEKQLVTSATWAIGTASNQLLLNVTGGQIIDGITWWGDTLTDSISSRRQFMPVNNDLSFATGLLEKRISITDFMRFNIGYAYHYVDYKDRDRVPYSPEQQGFVGTELHVYWPQRQIHFYAYGEAVYTSSYYGWVEEGLGDEIITNVKLSFQIKRFRFHYVLEDALNRAWQSREFFTRPGRYMYYGFTWAFSY